MDSTRQHPDPESQPSAFEPQVSNRDDQPSRRTRRTRPSPLAPGGVPGAFIVLALLSLAVALPCWLASDSAGASLAVCACIALVSIWYAQHNARLYGGLTFSSCFVLVSAFVFGARGVYVSLFNDFSILIALNQPQEHRMFTEALAYVLFGTLAFILGALLLERRAGEAAKANPVSGKTPLCLGTPDVSLLFLGLQVVFLYLLLPHGQAQERASLAAASQSAYVYLLPMLIHGFNLYIFSYLMSAWSRKRGMTQLVLLLISCLLMLAHAYCLYNLSNFRSFYLVGLFTMGVVFLRGWWGKVPVFFLVAVFALYPLFKNMGADRTLSNKQMVNKVILNPEDSYNAEGMTRAFGDTTDINMLDTLVASLNYEHKWHPYILTDLYVLVHWIPRSAWPGKPPFGILADLSYAAGLPFSPGIIGFKNDDGGKLYMIIMMGVLGAFLKWCERFVSRIRWRELQLSIWAALFFASLGMVRYLPYEAFYGFMIFAVPALLLNYGVRLVTGQTGAPRRLRKKKHPGAHPHVIS